MIRFGAILAAAFLIPSEARSTAFSRLLRNSEDPVPASVRGQTSAMGAPRMRVQESGVVFERLEDVAAALHQIEGPRKGREQQHLFLDEHVIPQIEKALRPPSLRRGLRSFHYPYLDPSGGRASSFFGAVIVVHKLGRHYILDLTRHPDLLDLRGALDNLAQERNLHRAFERIEIEVPLQLVFASQEAWAVADLEKILGPFLPAKTAEALSEASATSCKGVLVRLEPEEVPLSFKGSKFRAKIQMIQQENTTWPNRLRTFHLTPHRLAGEITDFFGTGPVLRITLTAPSSQMLIADPQDLRNLTELAKGVSRVFLEEN